MDLKKQAEQVERTADGRFAKGWSGNPAGRPPSKQSRARQIAELVLDGEAEVLIRKTVALAKQGHPVALRLCLERILPARRGRPVQVPLPEIAGIADAAAAFDAIVAAVAAGEITAGEAAEFGRFIQTLLQSGALLYRPKPRPE